MPTDPFPPHVEGLFRNLAEVRRLSAVHSEVGGTGRGRRFDLDILNKSGIVLAVACREAFVEDLARLAFDHLLAKATSPDTFPQRVLALAGAGLRAAKDEREVWRLAGDGWRAILEAHRDKTLAEFLDSFHTPRPAKVDALLEQLIGLRSVSSQWEWHKNTSEAVSKELNALIDLRGAIAHRVKVGRYVKKVELTRATQLTQWLAAVTSNRVREHLIARTAAEPWRHVTYSSAE